MNWVETLRIIGVVTSSLAMAMSIWSLWLGLRTNHRLIEDNIRLVRENFHLRRLLEDLTSKEN